MIDYMEVPNSMIKDNTVTSLEELKDKYANYNTVIPEGSLFYKSTLVVTPDLTWHGIVLDLTLGVSPLATL